MLWLSLLLFALLVLLPGLARAAGRVEARRGETFPGRPGEARLVLELVAPVPVYYRVECAGVAALGVLPRQYLGFGMGRVRLVEDLALSPRRRGAHALPRVRVFVRDVFGVWEREVPAAVVRGQVRVYPRIYPVPRPDLALTLLAEGPEVRGVGLEDPTQFRGVRPYAPGDPVRHVHWRATAHAGSLMVREFGRVRATGIWVHLDASGAGAVYLDHAAELAASLLVRANEERLLVALSAPGGTVPLARGDEAVRRALGVLAELEAEAAPRPVPVPPAGVNLVILTQHAPLAVVDGALKARSRAARVHLIALPEGFYLRPGERGRPLFGKPDAVLRLLRKRAVLEGEGVFVHLLRGNDTLARLSG